MTFSNPVYDANFPDPGVLKVGDTYYAYGTNDGARNVPLLTSKDLVRWSKPTEVLPELGGWVTPGHTWAPEVAQIADDRYVVYYTARSTTTNLQCVGAAVADNPRGPFVDESDTPLICEADEGGSIDASPFRDADGSLYLHWKNDGNHIGVPTHLYGQRLAKDGLSLLGERVRLLTNHAAWHGKVIEAPQLHRRKDGYYLLYSANAYDADAYAVGYARCDGPLGPCHDAGENPILASAKGAAGPGHCSMVVGPDGQDWLLYHAWPPDAIGSADPGRQMWLDRVEWSDGKPVVRGPTADPQPAPVQGR
ncbi:MAG: family 43 glycosylhydrolase [Micromonosporaceae bacterium]|nr:family 43 glycosylhydrolase [Micromonosporaceae bacterium]